MLADDLEPLPVRVGGGVLAGEERLFDDVCPHVEAPKVPVALLPKENISAPFSTASRLGRVPEEPASFLPIVDRISWIGLEWLNGDWQLQLSNGFFWDGLCQKSPHCNATEPLGSVG